jgi:hypothetical protein
MNTISTQRLGFGQIFISRNYPGGIALLRKRISRNKALQGISFLGEI